MFKRLSVGDMDHLLSNEALLFWQNKILEEFVLQWGLAALVRKAAKFITKMLVIFGLLDAQENEIGFGFDDGRETLLTPYLDAPITHKDDARDALKGGLPNKRIFARIFMDSMVDLRSRAGMETSLTPYLDAIVAFRQEVREALEGGLPKK